MCDDIKTYGRFLIINVDLSTLYKQKFFSVTDTQSTNVTKQWRFFFKKRERERKTYIIRKINNYNNRNTKKIHQFYLTNVLSFHCEQLNKNKILAWNEWKMSGKGMINKNSESLVFLIHLRYFTYCFAFNYLLWRRRTSGKKTKKI